MNPDPPGSLLTTQPPKFTATQACAIARAHFGFETSAEPLWSDSDQNFHLCTSSGEQFVLKIANALESPEVIDFQTRALEHIATADPELPVPRTIPTGDGQNYCLVPDIKGREHMARLITWLDGRIMAEAQMSPDLLRETGQILARLGIALKEFSHPAASHHRLWDLKNAAELLELLPHIEEPALRTRVEKALNLFVRNVHPVIGSLRSQIIHADLNRGNILFSASKPIKVTGIIDFGDMVRTSLVMDLAIAAAYHLADSGDPLARALQLIRGYHEVTPLKAIEAELLFDLMTARLCTSIIVQTWRAKLYPENAEYLMIHNRQVRDALKHIMACPADDCRRQILHACGHA